MKKFKLGICLFTFIILGLNSVFATWYNTSYASCRVATITNPVNNALNEFPFLLKLNASRDFSTAQPAGDDILIVNGSSCTDSLIKLPHEIEYFNNTATDEFSYIWLKVNLTALNSRTVLIYYNSPSADNQSDPTNVWDSDYEVVYHLTNFDDSTSNNNDADNEGTSLILSQVAYGREFDVAETDFINTNNLGIYKSNSIITISYWGKLSDSIFGQRVYTETDQGDGDAFYSFGNAHDTAEEKLTITILNDLGNVVENGNYGTLDAFDNSYHHIVIVDNNGDYQYYVDGAKGYSNSYVRGTTTSIDYSNLGRYNYNGADSGYIDGILDEVRVSSSARSADWINATYFISNTPLTYLSLGTSQSQSTSNSPSVVLSSNFTNTTVTTSNYAFTYNGTMTNVSDFFNCTLNFNSSLNYSETDLNLTLNILGNSTVPTPNGNYLVNLTCFNENATDELLYYWIVDISSPIVANDTTYLININNTVTSINSSVNTIEGDLEMFAIVILYGILLFFGYYTMRTGNYVLGLPYLLSTIGFNFYFWRVWESDSTKVVLAVVFASLTFGSILMFLFAKAKDK